MKKLLKGLVVLVLSLTCLFSVGCKNKKDNDSKVDTASLKTKFEDLYMALDTIEYNEFSITYEEKTGIQRQKVEMEYDAINGEFHCYEDLEEYTTGGDHYVKDVHIWVDDTDVIYAVSYYRPGYNNNIAIKQYTVDTYYSNEEALEYFNEQFENFSGDDWETFLYPNTPDVFVIGLNDEHLGMFKDCITDKNAKVTVKTNSATKLDVSMQYGESGSYSIVVENGYVTSYTQKDVIGEFKYTYSSTSSFEIPSLTGYNQVG